MPRQAPRGRRQVENEEFGVRNRAQRFRLGFERTGARLLFALGAALRGAFRRLAIFFRGAAFLAAAFRVGSFRLTVLRAAFLAARAGGLGLTAGWAFAFGAFFTGDLEWISVGRGAFLPGSSSRQP